MNLSVKAFAILTEEISSYDLPKVNLPSLTIYAGGLSLNLLSAFVIDDSISKDDYVPLNLSVDNSSLRDE